MRTMPKNNNNQTQQHRRVRIINSSRKKSSNSASCNSNFGIIIIILLLINAVFIIGNFSGIVKISLLENINTKRFVKQFASRDNIIKYTGIDPHQLLKRFINLKNTVIKYKLDKRGKAIMRYRKSLPTNYPSQGSSHLQKFHETLLKTVETFPKPSGRNLIKLQDSNHLLKVAIVRGDGTGWVVGATSQVAGSQLIFDEKSKSGCPSDKEWDICWVDGWVGGADGMGTANKGYFPHREDPKRIHGPLYNSYNIVGEKRTLFRNLVRASSHYLDKSYEHVMPRSFELPKHREQLMKIIKRGKSSDLWIAKPSYGSTARGIYVFNKDSKVGIPDENLKGQDAAWIIQQYLNPLLLHGHKFDMRLHTFVRLNPLRIYIHQDAVVRLASEKYVANGKVDNKCMHITNQAYQTPKCPKYIKNTDIATAEQSHLWNLKTLLNYLSKEYYGGGSSSSSSSSSSSNTARSDDDNDDDDDDNDLEVEDEDSSLDDLLNMHDEKDGGGKDNKNKKKKNNDDKEKKQTQTMKLKYSSPEVLWEKTQELLVKSVLASDEWSEDKLKYKEDNGFSFLGPDVAIDNEGKPFLLEINAFPTTSVSTPLGVQLKLQMLTDMYRMLGVGGYNDAGRRYGKYVKKRIQTYCNDPKYDKRKKQKKKKKNPSFISEEGAGQEEDEDDADDDDDEDISYPEQQNNSKKKSSDNDKASSSSDSKNSNDNNEKHDNGKKIKSQVPLDSKKLSSSYDNWMTTEESKLYKFHGTPNDVKDKIMKDAILRKSSGKKPLENKANLPSSGTAGGEGGGSNNNKEEKRKKLRQRRRREVMKNNNNNKNNNFLKKNKQWWCTKKEIQILMQYEDEKAYSGSWELAFPTRIGLLDTYQSVTQTGQTKKWVPGHYNQFLWDYILLND